MQLPKPLTLANQYVVCHWLNPYKKWRCKCILGGATFLELFLNKQQSGVVTVHNFWSLLITMTMPGLAFLCFIQGQN